jgi:N-acetyl sugar amidotransferase
MDTTNPELFFDEKGVCNRCNEFKNRILPTWNYGKGREDVLKNTIQKIKEVGKNNKYDCVIGLSGGFDSSYMLHMAVKEWGLRPLVIHIDSCWDLPVATSNINKIIKKLGVQLMIEKINWEQMRDFQLALFKSGISSLDIPQDVAFITLVNQYAEKYRIKYLLNGGNMSTEVVTNPKSWCYGANDMVFVNDILKKYGTIDMRGYPFLKSYFRKTLDYFNPNKIIGFKPLDYIPYVQKDAADLLMKEYDFELYKQKHFESLLTKFLEGYWYLKRFNADIRKAQFSSLILTGQLSREDALKKLENDSLDEQEVKELFTQVAGKLEITEEELQSYFEMPLKGYDDYKNNKKLVRFIVNFKNLFIKPTVIQD